MCKSKWTFFPTYTVFTTTIQIRYTYPIGILISVHEKIIRQCLIITFFRKSQWTKSKEATELKGDLHGCPCESYTLLRLPLTASKQPRDGLWYKVSLEEVKELSTVCCSLCFRACGISVPLAQCAKIFFLLSAIFLAIMICNSFLKGLIQCFCFK